MAHFVHYNFSPEVKEKVAHLRWLIAANETLLALYRLEQLLRKANFNPDQPRVPGGSSDGGRWTGGHGGTSVILSDAVPDNFWKPGARLAQAGSRGRGGTSIRIGGQEFETTPAQAIRYSVADGEARVQRARVREIIPGWAPRPSFDETIEGKIAARRAEAEEARAKLAELTRIPPNDLIQAYRNANNPRDLLGRDTWPSTQGTVAVTTINKAPLFGVNSGAPPYTARDRVEARSILDSLLRTYPEIMDTGNIGRMPNDALYHAETNVLLRAARNNGGSLSGQDLEVHVDRPMCSSPS